MQKASFLFQKSVETVKNYGIGTFFKKTVWYLKQQKKNPVSTEQDSLVTKSYMDILFIVGCYLPHPVRYRVSHQREQLLAFNIVSNEVLYENLSLNMIKHYRIFVFYRCPYTDMIGRFIRIAKEHNKTVLFDVDDLVIDTKYTDQVKYIQKMNWDDRETYESGVERMKKTLLLCDGAITTTERLASELKNYVPEVFINRNVASERMIQLSEQEIYYRDVLPTKSEKELSDEEKKIQKEVLERNSSGTIRIGYFSGSITHNSDIEMILPVLRNIMKRYKNVELFFVGEINIPEELLEYKERIIAKDFVPWEKLPKLIASVDINIVPLENTIFNEAKSENKWIEAALVKIPTIASCVGAFQKMIIDGETGLLCKDTKEWQEKISRLIENKDIRKKLAENAYHYVKKNATTIETGYALSKYLKSKMSPNLFMITPSIEISGGILVALRHCAMLSAAGMDVTILNDDVEQKDITFEGKTLFVLSRVQNQILGRIDRAVATLWSTVDFLLLYPNIEKRYYLVQGYEVDFSKPGSFFRLRANQTYVAQVPIQYITISQWCKCWLKEKYGQEAKYAPNGIILGNFPIRKRNLRGKVRILVEGNSEDYFKNVDESFQIVSKLDKKKYEIWYMSYLGKPKKWYQVDKFFYKIPNTEVGKIYEQCDILIKSSLLESFSYPPLEMMATGGYCVVAPNGGNAEFLVNEENCLLYEQGNIDSAVKAIERICKDKELQNTLYENGLKTAKSRDWNNLEEEILTLYDNTIVK